MRRPTIMKRGKNLMGKGTEATLSFQTLADILGRDVPAEIDPDRRTLVTELTIRKSALNVRLRKGNQITISVPLGKRDCSRAAYTPSTGSASKRAATTGASTFMNTDTGSLRQPTTSWTKPGRSSGGTSACASCS